MFGKKKPEPTTDIHWTSRTDEFVAMLILTHVIHPDETEEVRAAMGKLSMGLTARQLASAVTDIINTPRVNSPVNRPPVLPIPSNPPETPTVSP